METTVHSRAWPAPTAPGPLHAVLQLPASKSLTNRALLLAALADGPSTLRWPLRSRDASIMIEGLRRLGVGIVEIEGTGAYGPDLRVTPPADGAIVGGVHVDCGLAGTAMRFLPLVAALASAPVSFDGDEAARRRPMSATIASLEALCVAVESDGGLPLTVSGSGSVAGGEIAIDASASSQFVSGLLLVAPRFERGLTLRHTGDRLPSTPHIEMTLAALRARGVDASSPEPGVWRVEPGPIAALDEQIEPDLSNAAPFLAAALVAGGSVSISGWPTSTTQVGAQLVDILPRFGGTAVVADGVCTVTGDGRIRGAVIDMGESGELSPTIAALATLAEGETRITGIGHIRGHETDRIQALVDDITALGGVAHGTDDGIAIEPARLSGGAWRAYDDHRIATAGALIGLRVPGVEVDDIGATAKTIPEFPELWAAMIA